MSKPEHRSMARSPSKAIPRTPYDLIGGEQGVRRLCERFYGIMDSAEEARDLRALHKQDLSAITDRLCDYLTSWLGGPRIWIEQHGSMCLTEVHDRYRIGPKLRDQWLFCMEKALGEPWVPPEIRVLLQAPLTGVANMVMNSETD